MKRLLALGLLGVTAAACTDSSVPSSPAPETAAPPVSFARQGSSQVVPGNYIVVFKGEVQDIDGEVRKLALKHAGRLKHTYKRALKGMALELSDAAVAALRAEPSVDYIEPDQIVSISTSQAGATWGLDRIDQLDLPLGGTYEYGPDGTGVTAYILDTGIRFNHTQFGGRASSGFDAVDGGSADDCHGHGTHVAGTVGATAYGVAKNVSLVAVRVLNCSGSGSYAGVIAGIEWVTANRVLPAVANMSLGGPLSSAVNTAVRNSIAAGVTYALAAGNEAQNACNVTPASTLEALTVGATTISDGWASFSNFGSCVDLLAPGVNITSAWHNTDIATNTISGTSMATPHVAGAAALYLTDNPSATPAAVASALLGNAVTGTINNVPAGTVNRFLYTGFMAPPVSPPPPPPPPPLDPPPVANITYTCSGFTCTFNGTSSTNETGYSWSFSGGGTATGPTVSRTFSARSSHTVTLTVTGPGGTASTSRTVNCNPKKCV